MNFERFQNISRVHATQSLNMDLPGSIFKLELFVFPSCVQNHYDIALQIDPQMLVSW